MPINPTGLTLAQVITVVDTRLITLESFMKDMKEADRASLGASLGAAQGSAEIPSNLQEVIEEYGNRFDIIADELANIKNMMLSLQSFTMDVNKTLMQERIRILSDTGACAESESTPLEKELAMESGMN